MIQPPQILVMCLADPSGNPRPNRMIELCNDLGFSVDVASFSSRSPLNCREHFHFHYPSLKLHKRIIRKIMRLITLFLPFEPISEFLNGQRWNYPAIFKKMKERDYDAIVVHDAWLLPLAFRIRNHAKIIFDAREFYPAEIEGNLLWTILDKPEKTRICRKYMPLCNKIMTVSPGLAERYLSDFGVKCELVRSVPLYREEGPSPLAKGVVRMVHHGGANRDRKLENMIDIVSGLDERFTLDFYLNGSPAYIQELKRRAEPHARIRFLNPVPFDQILPMLSNYDIGLYLLEPTGFNTWRSLPNKFFEFIQARLMVAIGPSPDMAELAEQYDCGIVAADFSAQTMSKALNELTNDDIVRMKNAADLAAKELCFEVEKQKIVSIFESVGLGQP